MGFLSDLLGDRYKEGMTEEELSAALEENSKSNMAELNRLKASLSKANSEAAEYKKQLRSKQSDAEAAADEQKKEREKLLAENTELKRSIALAENKAKLLSMGYDESLAETTAVAMVDGDMETVMANQSRYLEEQRKNIRADQMRQTPRPAVGVAGGGVDYAKKIEEARVENDLSAMAYYTRLQAQSEQSDEE